MKACSEDLGHSLTSQMRRGSGVWAGMIGTALAAALLMMSEPSNADAPGPSARITISSIQSADFAKLSQNKTLLVVSPDFSPLIIKSFEKKAVPNSLVVVSPDIPSKKAGIFVNGQLFTFQHLTNGKKYDFFEARDLSTVLAYLTMHWEELLKTKVPTSEPE